MNLQVWVDPRVEGVTAAHLREYLTSRGWKPRAYPRPELLVYEGPSDDDGTPITLVIPASERFKDFPPRSLEVITSLAALEGRYAGHVLDEILACKTAAPATANGIAPPPLAPASV